MYYLTFKEVMHGSQRFTCKLHLACIYLVSIHRRTLPLIVAADI